MALQKYKIYRDINLINLNSLGIFRDEMNEYLVLQHVKSGDFEGEVNNYDSYLMYESFFSALE